MLVTNLLNVTIFSLPNADSPSFQVLLHNLLILDVMLHFFPFKCCFVVSLLVLDHPISLLILDVMLHLFISSAASRSRFSFSIIRSRFSFSILRCLFLSYIPISLLVLKTCCFFVE
jgi:hypothetical protein